MPPSLELMANQAVLVEMAVLVKFLKVIHLKNIAVLATNKAIELAAVGALENAGMKVERYGNIAALMAGLLRDIHDAIVLEDCDYDLLNWMAMLEMQSGEMLPIVAIGPGGASKICRALLNGAKDYSIALDGHNRITLAERVLAQVQLRAASSKTSSPQIGGYVFDTGSLELRLNSRKFSLTHREFALAQVLFENAGRVVTLRSLSMQIWGKSSDVSKRTIEQYVYRLRRKLGLDSLANRAGIRIQTVYGIGYKLCECEYKNPDDIGVNAERRGMQDCDLREWVCI